MSDSIFLTDGNGTITDLVDKSYAGELVIPEYIGGERITTIEEWAFSTCNYLTSVVIPDSVISIGYYAFFNCPNLTSISIPNSVTSIGYTAFMACVNLTSIIIPNSITSISANIFKNCRNLTSVNIHDNIDTIDYGAFCGCSSLTSITIPDSVTLIGEQAFADCTNLTTVYVPDPNNLSTAVSSYDWTETGSSGITFLQDPRYIDYLIKGGSLINLADKIRILSGTSDAMTPAEMVEALNI